MQLAAWAVHWHLTGGVNVVLVGVITGHFQEADAAFVESEDGVVDEGEAAGHWQLDVDHG